MKQVANPAYNPYAEYSSDIHEEVNQVMTIVGMFEERGEKRGEERGEKRLMNLLQKLQEQGRDDEIKRLIMSGDKHPMLESLYAEFHL